MSARDESRARGNLGQFGGSGAPNREINKQLRTRNHFENSYELDNERRPSLSFSFSSLSLPCAHGRFYHNDQLSSKLRIFNNSTAVPPLPSPVDSSHPSIAQFSILTKKLFDFCFPIFLDKTIRAPRNYFLRHFRSRDRAIACYLSRPSFYSASPLPSCFYSSPRRRRGIATNA